MLLAVDAAGAVVSRASTVYTHVPQSTDPPYVVVLGGDEVPWAVTLADDTSPADYGDSGGRQCDVLVRCVTTYRGTEQVDAIASRVIEVLTDGDTWAGTAMTGFLLAEFVRNVAFSPTDLSGVFWFERTVTVRVTLS